MPNLRMAITWLALVAATAVSLGSMIRAFVVHPEFASTEREQLLEALALADFQHTPERVKRTFIRRLELDLRGQVDWNTRLADIPADDRQQVIANWNDLTQLWFHDKVEAYFIRSDRRRAGYLEQELAQLRSWRVVRETVDGETRLKLASIKLEELARLLEASPVKGRIEPREIDKFVADAQQALDRRTFRWLPGQK
jgi:hypothetical protein